MKTIIILDFTSVEVHILKYDEEKYDSPEEFMDEEHIADLGIKASNCQWMVTDSLKLTIH